MKINFYQIFKINPDGSLEPTQKVRIGGVEFGPGVTFSKGVSFSGIDLSQYVGRDFEAENLNEALVLKGIY